MEPDVNVESSTTEEVVNETNDQSQGLVETQSETPITPPGEVTPVNSDVDEYGVPYKNRYHEMKRKYEDISSKQDQILQKMDSFQTTQQQVKPTKEQLMAFISNEDTDPSHRTWALKEMDKLEEQRVSDTIKKEFTAYESKQQAERQKSDTFNFVIQRHPDIIIKDAAGRFVGWNTKNPLVQRMDVYMRNPEIAKNPQGLRVALALAKDDLSGTQIAKQQQLKTQVKTLQKGTLIEGGSPAPQGAIDTLARAKANLRKTGSKKDALAAVAEWHKKQGKFEE